MFDQIFNPFNLTSRRKYELDELLRDIENAKKNIPEANWNTSFRLNSLYKRADKLAQILATEAQ